MKLIDDFKQMTKIERASLTTKFSIILNLTLGISKLILSFFCGVFFLFASIINIFSAISKIICTKGMQEKIEKEKFNKRNTFIGVSLFIIGIAYVIYMARMLLSDVNIMSYDMVLGISVAVVSFSELGLAIIGIFGIGEHGHYYRNLKIINLATAIMAISHTEVAIMSFAHDGDPRLINALCGLIAGVFVCFLSLFIFFGPKFSISDKNIRTYRLIDKSKRINENNIKINITNSKFYGNYYYTAIVKHNKIKGVIKKGKNPLRKWNNALLILVIILSEILIFPYIVGWLIFLLRTPSFIKRLDKKMYSLGYEPFKGGKNV